MSGEEAHVLPDAFRPALWEPKRDAAFMSPTGFDQWKRKHPKVSAQYAYAEEDIDGDQIPEAIVRRGEHIVGVNGWELKPSRARYERATEYPRMLQDGRIEGVTDLWDSRARGRVAHNALFYDEDLKDIRKEFGKLVVKPVFDSMYGKEGVLVKGQKRTSSYFTKQVIKLLAENELDGELLQKYAADASRRFPGSDDPEQFPEQRKAALAMLHHSKEFKQVLKSRLGQINRDAGSFAGKVRSAILASAQLGTGEAPKVLADTAIITDLPGN
jgi:hypothetical protein